MPGDVPLLQVYRSYRGDRHVRRCSLVTGLSFIPWGQICQEMFPCYRFIVHTVETCQAMFPCYRFIVHTVGTDMSGDVPLLQVYRSYHGDRHVRRCSLVTGLSFIPWRHVRRCSLVTGLSFIPWRHVRRCSLVTGLSFIPWGQTCQAMFPCCRFIVHTVGTNMSGDVPLLQVYRSYRGDRHIRRCSLVTGLSFILWGQTCQAMFPCYRFIVHTMGTDMSGDVPLLQVYRSYCGDSHVRRCSLATGLSFIPWGQTCQAMFPCYRFIVHTSGNWPLPSILLRSF